MEVPGQRQTFIVRLTLDDGGGVSGVVERVRTGEKERFDSAAALADLIPRMAKRETTARRQEHLGE
jgi:hypothetical protein